nr:Biomphalaria glabrata cytoplasmic tRNA 2-thiolation protein 2-like [Biomphalaria glabrata]
MVRNSGFQLTTSQQMVKNSGFQCNHHPNRWFRTEVSNVPHPNRCFRTVVSNLPPPTDGLEQWFPIYHPNRCLSTANSRQHQLNTKFFCRQSRLPQDAIPEELLSDCKFSATPTQYQGLSAGSLAFLKMPSLKCC